MSNELSRPTERFSDRVENFVRYRPDYPPEVLALLEREIGLTRQWTIADVGSGTGISTELFLQHGNIVYGVEPNAPMRGAAERLLAGYLEFRSIDGTAEATTLADRSIDCIVAAQAFHWFDVPRTRAEFARILRPEGWVVLMWNARHLDSSPFLREYEALLQRFGTDYGQVRHENVTAAQLQEFYGHGDYVKLTLENVQRLDRAGLVGRLLSSSYMPGPDHPQYAAMLLAADQLFADHQREGIVAIEYDVELYFGQLVI